MITGDDCGASTCWQALLLGLLRFQIELSGCCYRSNVTCGNGNAVMIIGDDKRQRDMEGGRSARPRTARPAVLPTAQRRTIPTGATSGSDCSSLLGTQRQPQGTHYQSLAGVRRCAISNFWGSAAANVCLMMIRIRGSSLGRKMDSEAKNDVTFFRW